MKRKHVGFALFLIICGITINIAVFAQAQNMSPTEIKNTATTITVGTTPNTLYTTINEAISHAPPGATLYISEGTYDEIITISKPLTLIGMNKETTILAPTSSPNSYALQIRADNVVLQSLSITNLGSGLYTTGVKISGSHTTIDDCIIYDTPVGAALWSSDNTITRTVFRKCSDEGIALLGTSQTPCLGNSISFCDFSGNCDGIELQCALATRISDCMFTSNTHAGIDIIGAENRETSMVSCSFSDNPVFGVYVSGSTDTQIDSCSFKNSMIQVAESDEILVKDSVFDTNIPAKQSLHMVNCLYAQSSSVNTKNVNDAGLSDEKSLQKSTSNQNLDHSTKVLTKIVSFIQTLRDRLQLLRQTNHLLK
jgi:nitrous oxidase accessory protein NosD